MHWDISLYGVIKLFGEEAKLLAAAGDLAGLGALYESFTADAKTATNEADAAWFLRELQEILKDAMSTMPFQQRSAA